MAPFDKSHTSFIVTIIIIINSEWPRRRALDHSARMLKGVPSPICWIHEWRGRPGCRRQPGPKRWPVLAAATCDNARWAVTYIACEIKQLRYRLKIAIFHTSLNVITRWEKRLRIFSRCVIVYNMVQNIAEKFNPLTRMHQSYGRQTDDRRNFDVNSRT